MSEMDDLINRLRWLEAAGGPNRAKLEKECADRIEAQDAEIARYRKTLAECRTQFDFYASEHRKAEKHDKAATNERFALLISQALQEPK